MPHPGLQGHHDGRAASGRNQHAPIAPIEMKIVRHNQVERDVESVFAARPPSTTATAVQVVFRRRDQRQGDERRARRPPRPCAPSAWRTSLIEEQERRRIANALDDGIARRWPFPAVSWVCSGTRRRRAGRWATRGGAPARQQCLDYTRTLVFDSAPILYGSGSEAALSRLTENMEKQYGPGMTVRGRGGRAAERQRAGRLFQAARELLANAEQPALPGEGVHRTETLRHGAG